MVDAISCTTVTGVDGVTYQAMRFKEGDLCTTEIWPDGDDSNLFVIPCLVSDEEAKIAIFAYRHGVQRGVEHGEDRKRREILRALGM